MYVCICNGITDKDIKGAVAEGGVNDAEEVYMSLGSSFCCGQCKDCAESLVAHELPKRLLLAAE